MTFCKSCQTHAKNKPLNDRELREQRFVFVCHSLKTTIGVIKKAPYTGACTVFRKRQPRCSSSASAAQRNPVLPEELSGVFLLRAATLYRLQ